MTLTDDLVRQYILAAPLSGTTPLELPPRAS